MLPYLLGNLVSDEFNDFLYEVSKHTKYTVCACYVLDNYIDTETSMWAKKPMVRKERQTELNYIIVNFDLNTICHTHLFFKSYV